MLCLGRRCCVAARLDRSLARYLPQTGRPSTAARAPRVPATSMARAAAPPRHGASLPCAWVGPRQPVPARLRTRFASARGDLVASQPRSTGTPALRHNVIAAGAIAAAPPSPCCPIPTLRPAERALRRAVASTVAFPLRRRAAHGTRVDAPAARETDARGRYGAPRPPRLRTARVCLPTAARRPDVSQGTHDARGHGRLAGRHRGRAALPSRAANGEGEVPRRGREPNVIGMRRPGAARASGRPRTHSHPKRETRGTELEVGKEGYRLAGLRAGRRRLRRQLGERLGVRRPAGRGAGRRGWRTALRSSTPNTSRCCRFLSGL